MFLQIISTERRGARVCWEKSKPKGQKGKGLPLMVPTRGPSSGTRRDSPQDPRGPGGTCRRQGKTRESAGISSGLMTGESAGISLRESAGISSGLMTKSSRVALFLGLTFAWNGSGLAHLSNPLHLILRQDECFTGFHCFFCFLHCSKLSFLIEVAQRKPARGCDGDGAPACQTWNVPEKQKYVRPE